MPDIDPEFYIVACDFCTSQYHHGEPMEIEGVNLQLISPESRIIELKAVRQRRRDKS